MKTRSLRLRRWVIIAASAFALYLVVGFFVLPPIVRGQLVKRAGAALEREVAVERVRMNPLTFTTTIRGLRIVDHDGADLVSWRELFVNADPLASLFTWRWRLGEFRLAEFRGRVVLDEQGTLNIADLIEKFSSSATVEPEPEEATPGELPAAAVKRVRIQDAAIDFADRSRGTPFHTVFGPMTFNVDGLTTRQDSASPYTFAGTTDSGETFAWSGNVSVAPVGSTGRIALTGFSIPKHMPFAEPWFAGVVQSGHFSFAGDYRVVLAANPVAQIENATVAVDELRVAMTAEAEPLLQLPHFQIDVARADALQRSAEIAKVAIAGLAADVRRDAAGAINVLQLLKRAGESAENSSEPGSPPAEDAAVASAAPAPSVHVALIEMSDGRMALTDESGSRPARVVFDQITLSAQDAGTDLARDVGLQLSARWNERGNLAARGTVRPQPLATVLEVNGENIELAALDPLLEPFADVRLESGAAWFKGTLEATQPAGEALALTWRGDAGLDQLDARSGASHGELVAWQRFAVSGSEVRLAPLAVAIKEVALVDPVVHAGLDENGVFNLLAILKTSAEPAATEAVAPPAEAAAPAVKTSERVAAATSQPLAFDAQVETVSISGARLFFADRSFAPGFATDLRDFGGTIRGLSSATPARADVDLKGTLRGGAPLHIHGQINPLAEDMFSDVQIDFSNIELPLFSPYAGRFIGQKIEKGTLQVDLAYKLSQRVLQGENKVVFDQFYLGEKVESEESLGLPVGLALALLRDRQGKIPLDVPVRGNLDDPEFKYGRIVWQAISNILVKAATSPFSLLGNMFGGGQELDLSYVDFVSGSAAISPEAGRKLEVMAKALFERPALRLELNAPPAPETDRAGLATARLQELLLAERERLRGLSAGPEPQAAPVGTELTAEETTALIASLFAVRFPNEAAAVAASVPGTAAAPGGEPATARDAEARPGLLRRVWRSVLGRSEEAPAAREERGETVSTPEAATATTAPVTLTPEVMRERLLETIELTPEDFAALATQRTTVIRETLLAGGNIEPERIITPETASVPEGASPSSDGGRVFFGLQ